jgi:site-specific recombinase XerD
MTERKPGRPKGTQKESYKGMSERELAILFKETRKRKDRLAELAFKLCFHFALRVSELVAIRLDDIFLGKEKSDLSISIQGRKHGRKRVYQGTEIDSRLGELVRRWVRRDRRADPANPYLFPSPRYWDRATEPQTIKNKFKTYLHRAGLPEYYSVHSLRHSCAYHLIEKGWNLIEIRNWLRLRDLGNVQCYLDKRETQMGGRVGEDGAFGALM